MLKITILLYILSYGQCFIHLLNAQITTTTSKQTQTTTLTSKPATTTVYIPFYKGVFLFIN